MPKNFGSYQLTEPIGAGGMGEVWRADHPPTGKTVALKFLRTEALDDPELAQRFRQECLFASKIAHPHVLPVYDFDIGDQPYIAMRFIDGVDLAGELERAPGHRLSPERTVHIVRQVASALEAAHAQQIRHRDVKPSNIVLEQLRPEADHAWLIDWGIAQVIDTEGSEVVTRTGAIVGTPAYVAPDRLKSGITSDHRADVYSLAVVLYECLAGYRPIDGSHQPVLDAQLREDPKPLPVDVPIALQAVVAKGLAKDPEDRYQSARELALAADAAIAEWHDESFLRSVRQSALMVIVPGALGALLGLLLLATDFISATSLLFVQPALAAAGALAGYFFTAGTSGASVAAAPAPPQTTPFRPGRLPTRSA